MRNDRPNRAGDTDQAMSTIEQLRLLASHQATALRRLFTLTSPKADAGQEGASASAAGSAREQSPSAALSTSLELTTSDTTVSMLTSGVAAAVAIDEYPSPESARVALAAVKDLRDKYPTHMSGIVGIAFRGTGEPSNETIDVLEDGCVYVAVNNLRPSAIDNAKTFLAEVDSQVPEARRIAMLGQVPH